MFALGLLFIACIFLATGGAALPLIGGAIAASQGLFIAGAVGAGLYGAVLFAKDQIGQGNNNQGGMKMVEGPGAESQSKDDANKGQAQGQAQAQEKSPAPEKAQAQAQGQEKSPAPLPDLMELMKKDILRGFKSELDNNPKFSNIGKNISDDTDSKPYEATLKSLYPIDLSSDDLKKLSALPNDTKDKLSKVGAERPDEVTNKLPKAESENIERDSKSQSQAIQALNLEMPKTRSDPPSPKSWAQRMSSRGTSGAREV
jgi:hypothetical protein